LGVPIQGEPQAAGDVLGPFPELSLSEARAKHAAACQAVVVDKADPLAERRDAKAMRPAKANAPTFGERADAYLKAHEAGWKNPKHRDQWRMTLTRYCAAIRDTPVDREYARCVLPRLRTGVASHDAQDEALTQKINAA
jgi:hypothetical protein